MKYFWKNGYINIMGSVAIIIIALKKKTIFCRHCFLPFGDKLIRHIHYILMLTESWILFNSNNFRFIVKRPEFFCSYTGLCSYRLDNKINTSYAVINIVYIMKLLSAKERHQMKVLIVDDDIYVKIGLEKLIPWKALHFDEILYADNGSSAYDIALQEFPDLIITDVKMPVMSGVDLCKKISETDMETSIIMLSAYDDFEFTRAALNYNVKDYILKPLNTERIEQIINKIKALMSMQQRRQNLRRILYNNELSARVSASLHRSDLDDINSLFWQDLSGMQLERSEIRDCCLQLVHLLFDYTESLDFYTHDPSVPKRMDSVEYILSVKTPSEIYSYTNSLYTGMMEALSARRLDTNPLVNEMCMYIDKNYSDAGLSVTKVAQDLHIAPGYAGPLFKNYKGIRMQHYISNLRIEKASRLLKDVKLKVNEIGEMVGIPDTNHFCKIFKKIKGLSPTEYRNTNF